MKKKIVIFILLSLSLLPLTAHPHMAISYSCDFHFQDNELTGAWINFAFDRYFSVDISNTYDEDKNGTFNSDETDLIYNYAFINLEKYGFFISVRDQNGRTSPGEVSDFVAYLDEEEILNYRFYIELEENDERELFLSVYDPTYFCATYMDESNPVSVKAEPPHQTKYEVVENTDYPVYYDPYAPASDTTIYDKWRPGLNTYFPEEIHLVY